MQFGGVFETSHLVQNLLGPTASPLPLHPLSPSSFTHLSPIISSPFPVPLITSSYCLSHRHYIFPLSYYTARRLARAILITISFVLLPKYCPPVGTSSFGSFYCILVHPSTTSTTPPRKLFPSNFLIPVTFLLLLQIIGLPLIHSPCPFLNILSLL